MGGLTNMNTKKQTRALAALLMSAMLLTACGGSTEEEAPAGPVGIAVQVQTVARRDIFAENRASGKLTADNEVSLMVATAAKCLDVYVQAGDMVTAGQKLCKLDLGSTLANRNAAQINYNATVRNLNDARAVQDSVVAMKQELLDTTKALFEIGAASQLEVDSAQLELDSAKMQRNSTVSQLEAGVQQAKASLEQLGTALDHVDSEGNLVAPIDGVLASFSAVKDSFVTNSMPVAVIDGVGGMKVTTSVSEAVVPKLHIGDAAEVRVTATGEVYTAVIRAVDRASNLQTQLYTVTLELPAEAEGLYTGMFADVTFHTDGSPNAVVIPSEAIQTSNDVQYVYVVENGAAKYVEITTGLIGSGVTEVLSGLTGGEQLVTVGQAYLADGDAVRIVAGESAPAQTEPVEEQTPTEEEPAAPESADAASAEGAEQEPEAPAAEG